MTRGTLRVLAFMADGVTALLSLSLLASIFAYQRFLSPLIGPRCRYQPTCSAYAVQAIRRYGPVAGGLRAVWRVLRCHPWSRGGWDPP